MITDIRAGGAGMRGRTCVCGWGCSKARATTTPWGCAGKAADEAGGAPALVGDEHRVLCCHSSPPTSVTSKAYLSPLEWISCASSR